MVTYRKKMLLALLAATAMTGAVSAADQTVEPSQDAHDAVATSADSSTSQSSMISFTKKPIIGDVGAKVDSAAAAVAMPQEIALSQSADDPALYLSSSDTEAVRSLEGKTVTAIDIPNVPDEVKTSLMPLLITRVGDTLSVAGVESDVSALGSTGVFARISPRLETVPEGVKLSYATEANPVITGVQIEGNTVFSTAQIQEILGIAPNSVLNTTMVRQRLIGLENLYMQQGYILFSIPEIHISSQGVLRIRLAEGVVEDIVLEGNEKTKDYVILRELRYRKGQPFNKFLASRSMERLYNLGFFEDVNMRLLPGVADHSVVTEIEVIEQRTGVATIGAGYSKSDGMMGILELGENNFRGTGDKINFHWEFGGSSRGRNYQISYTRPWINSNGDSLGLSVFDRRSKFEDYNADGATIATYYKRRKGFNATWARVTSEYRKNYFTLETLREDYDDYGGFVFSSGVPASVQPYWKQAIFDNFGRTNSFTFSHVYDTRDNYFAATKGRRLSATVQYAGHGLGGNFNFYKISLEGRFYKGLSNGHTLALRLRGGYIHGDSSYNMLFNLGGSDSLRGYEDYQFKGEKMYAATLEYRVPIAKKIEGVVFTDVGNAWGVDPGKIPWYQDSTKIRTSYGVGLRVQTPIGPVRLDYGRGDKGKFHFSFGAQF